MAPDFTGKWVANLQNSRVLGPAPREMRVTIIHAEPEFKVKMSITTVEGKVQEVIFEGRTNGEEIRNIVLGQEWRSRMRWVGMELLIESWVNHSGRDLHFCDYWSLSADRRTLTMEHRDDALPGQITVLDRSELWISKS